MQKSVAIPAMVLHYCSKVFNSSSASTSTLFTAIIFFHSSLCACLAFLVLVCCLVCRSCPLARSSINISSHDYQASTRHHLQKCSIYIDCQVVSRQSNKVSSSRNTGPPSFSSENMIIFLMILVISRLVLVGDDHLRLSI